MVSDWGIDYVVPQEEQPTTVIAVNVGGALIPTVLSLYLLFKNRLLLQSLVGVAIVAVIVNRMASAVPGVGITMPPFIPPLLAAGVALFSRGNRRRRWLISRAAWAR